MNNGFGNHDLWISKLDGETWKQAVSRFQLYPEDTQALMDWAAREDDKRLSGSSLVGNDFFIPADPTPAQAADEAIQLPARLKKAKQASRDAEHDAAVELLRAEAEYRHRYLRPGVPQHARDLAAVNLMTAEQLEERLLPEILEKLHPEIVAAICERYLKLEGVVERDRWGPL